MKLENDHEYRIAMAEALKYARYDGAPGLITKIWFYALLDAAVVYEKENPRLGRDAFNLSYAIGLCPEWSEPTAEEMEEAQRRADVLFGKDVPP